jgi:hypothetical protein
MTGPALPEGEPQGAAPVVALLDCGPEEAARHVAALVDLAGRLGMAVRTEAVSAACTTLSLRLAPEGAGRFQAALLLGGATILPVPGTPGTDLTVIVTTSARAARSE